MTARLVAVLAGVTAVVLLALMVPLSVSFQTQRRDALATSLERDALRIGDTAEDRLEGTSDRDLDPLVASYHTQTGGRAVIIDLDGFAIADSEPQPAGASAGRSFLSRPEIAAALNGQTPVIERRSETLDETLFIVAAPVRSGDRILGVVRVSQSTHELAEAVRRYRTRLAAVAAGALGAAVALGLAAGRWATRPIRRLQQAAAALGAGKLNARAPADHGPPEVRDLARRFNTMAEDLERLVTASTEFAADVSHQLRTPLTAARLHLGTLDRSRSDDQPALERLDDDLDRIQRTIDGLLALTRIERTLPRLQRVDLTEAIDQRRQTWAATAEDAGIELLAEASPGDSATFDPHHLEQVLDNLIDNALAFAPRGTRIGHLPVGRTVVMTLEGTAAPTRWAGRRPGCCEAAWCCTS